MVGCLMLYLDPIPLGNGGHVLGLVLARNAMHLRSGGVHGNLA